MGGPQPMAKTTPQANEQDALAPILDGPFAGLAIKTGEDRDPRDVQRDILRRMAAATSIDELFRVREGDDSRAMVGRRLRILSADWDTYEADDGPIPMARIRAVDLNSGEDVTFRSTAPNVTGFVAVCEQRGWLPQEVVMRSEKTRSGNDVLYLERA